MSEVKKLPLKKQGKNTGKSIKQEIFNTAFNFSQLQSVSLPHIEADGNRELLIEGCKGIIAYEEGRISLNTGKLVVTVIGGGIEIKAFSDIQTVISGDIISISFVSVQGDKDADN